MTIHRKRLSHADEVKFARDGAVDDDDDDDAEDNDGDVDMGTKVKLMSHK